MPFGDVIDATPKTLSCDERAFLNRHRVAHFATADTSGQPHVVPVCFTVLGETLYFSIDEKPKRNQASRLKRIRNIEANPKVAVVVDYYDEDWRKLGWVMVRGKAALLWQGDEHVRAQAALKEKYSQLEQMEIRGLPVVATRIERVASWGCLT